MIKNVEVRLRRASWADQEIALPKFQTDGAAGADLRANFPVESRSGGTRIDGGAWELIPVGFHIEIPFGCEGQIRPRSGLALKFGISVFNNPGTIDSDYRGEVGVILMNHSSKSYVVGHGDRIAQLVIATVLRPTFQMAKKLSTSKRLSRGFGSTGVE